MALISMNPDNLVNLTGRIETKDMAAGIFKNNDGSRKMRFTLAVQDGYQKKDGSTGKQDIPVEAFIPASQVKTDDTGVETYGIYSTLRTGDLVNVMAHLESNNYEKDGKMVYGGIIVRVDYIKHREPKAVSANRETKKSAEAAYAAAVANKE